MTCGCELLRSAGISSFQSIFLVREITTGEDLD